MTEKRAALFFLGTAMYVFGLLDFYLSVSKEEKKGVFNSFSWMWNCLFMESFIGAMLLAFQPDSREKRAGAANCCELSYRFHEAQGESGVGRSSLMWARPLRSTNSDDKSSLPKTTTSYRRRNTKRPVFGGAAVMSPPLAPQPKEEEIYLSIFV